MNEHELYDELFWAAIIGGILTWGLSLTPPLLIRYVFLKRPISTYSAGWIAAGFSFLFFLAFTPFRKPGYVTGAWVLVFFVARWIMSRGFVPERAEDKGESFAHSAGSA